MRWANAKLTIPSSSPRHCGGSVQHGLFAAGGALGFYQPGCAADERYSLGVANTMSAVESCEVPANSLLRSYKDGDGYADCYVAEIQGSVTQQDFIEAFYTSPLFKIERTILKYLASKPASDAEARLLAAGKAASFSAWKIEKQSTEELLLVDFTGRTRSWLMAQRATGSATTLLYFGSAVVPRKSRHTHRPGMGWAFHALLRFHRLYSRMLLSAAHKRLGQA